jgi:hypothetical protein
MARYVPTAEEQAAIDLLTLSGHAVLRQRSYDALRERVRVAEVLRESDREQAEHARAWARDQISEQRRLTDRLNAVCTAAAALGVPITDINAALDAASARQGA